MGLSSQPEGGYDKRTQAADIRTVLTALNLDRAAIVGIFAYMVLLGRIEPISDIPTRRGMPATSGSSAS